MSAAASSELARFAYERDMWTRADFPYQQASLATFRGRLDEALKWASIADEAGERSGHQEAAIFARFGRGGIRGYAAGDYRLIEEYLRVTIEACEAIGSVWLFTVWLVLGSVLTYRGLTEAAKEACRRGLRLQPRSTFYDGYGQTVLAIAGAYAEDPDAQ